MSERVDKIAAEFSHWAKDYLEDGYRLIETEIDVGDLFDLCQEYLDLQNKVDTITQLRRENDELRKLAQLTAHDRSFLRVSVENSSLRRENERLTEALRFYADENNWALTETTFDEERRPFWKFKEEIKEDSFELEQRQVTVGGKRAREALKDCEELK
jgi:FtsZ-binding cell division protein ZapB